MRRLHVVWFLTLMLCIDGAVVSPHCRVMASRSVGVSSDADAASERFSASYSQADGPLILRVLLSDSLPLVNLGASGRVQILDSAEKVLGEWASPVTAEVKLDRLHLKSPSGSLQGSRFILASEDGGYLSWQNRKYRGRLQLSLSSKGAVLLLNLVELEDYLRGVVPAEMPSLWAAEAVKAQAVAARTYAVQRARQNRDAPFDLYATTADQLYSGASKEHPASDAAIAATRGQVITYQGEPIIAYYHSASGGRTRTGKLPYLVSVESPEVSTHDSWRVELSLEELAEALRKGGENLGELLEVSVSRSDEGMGASALDVRGSDGKTQVSPSRLRSLIGLNIVKSPSFAVEVQGGMGLSAEFREIHDWMRVDAVSAYSEKEVKVRRSTVTSGKLTRPMYHTYYAVGVEQRSERIVLTGGGYGHGVGMSQWGAKWMAEHGSTWEEIVKHYYGGVEIMDIVQLGVLGRL